MKKILLMILFLLSLFFANAFSVCLPDDGTFDMGGYAIANVGITTNNNDIVTKEFVDNHSLLEANKEIISYLSPAMEDGNNGYVMATTAITLKSIGYKDRFLSLNKTVDENISFFVDNAEYFIDSKPYGGYLSTATNIDASNISAKLAQSIYLLTGTAFTGKKNVAYSDYKLFPRIYVLMGNYNETLVQTISFQIRHFMNSVVGGVDLATSFNDLFLSRTHSGFYFFSSDKAMRHDDPTKYYVNLSKIDMSKTPFYFQLHRTYYASTTRGRALGAYGYGTSTTTPKEFIIARCTRKMYSKAFYNVHPFDGTALSGCMYDTSSNNHAMAHGRSGRINFMTMYYGDEPYQTGLSSNWLTYKISFILDSTTPTKMIALVYLNGELDKSFKFDLNTTHTSNTQQKYFVIQGMYSRNISPYYNSGNIATEIRGITITKGM